MRLIQRCTCRRYTKAGELCKCGKRPPKDSYIIEYRHQGSLLREKVGPKDLAQVRMGEIKRAILEKRYLNINKNATTTLGEVIDWYISLSDTIMLRSYSERVRSLKKAGAALGLRLPLTEVSPASVQSYEQERLRHVAPASVNREISYIKACLNKAVQFQMIESNPIAGFRSLEEDNHRDVGISENELNELCKNCPDWMKSIVYVAFYTMMRRGEILGLKRSMIDWGKMVINLPGSLTKSGKDRSVPICNKISDIFMDRRRHMESERLFPINGYSTSYFAKCFSEAVKRTGLDDFRFHDLRHSSAQWYYENGNDIHTILSVGGWSSYDMLKRYLQNKNKTLNVKFG